MATGGSAPHSSEERHGSRVLAAEEAELLADVAAREVGFEDELDEGDLSIGGMEKWEMHEVGDGAYLVCDEFEVAREGFHERCRPGHGMVRERISMADLASRSILHAILCIRQCAS